MFERDSMEVAGFGDLDSAPDTFIFLGGTSVFPNVILRVVEQEASGARALRLNSVSDLQKFAGRDKPIRKVFFDDRLAAEVFREIHNLRSQMPATDWILAYRDQAFARRLLDARAQTSRLSDILLLPMNLPIGPWSSMLRLVLAGQFVAVGELFGPGTAAEQQQAAMPAAAQSESKTPEAQSPPPRRFASNPGLTQREKEVLAMVSEGGRNKSIAHKMSLSEHTVKLHLHNAITKIGARNRTEAATWFLSHRAGD